MRKRRTLGIGCGSVVGLLGLALGGGWLYLQSDAGEKRVESLVEDLVRDSLEAGDLAFGELDLKGTTLVLTDVTADGAEHDGVLTIPRIEAEVRLRSILGRTLHVERARITRPTVTLHRLEDGAFDLPVFASSDAPPDPEQPTTFLPAWLTVDVDDLLLTGGQVFLPDDEVHVRDVGLAASADITETTVDLDLQQLDWDVARPMLGAGRLTATAGLEREDLTALEATLVQSGATLTLDGRIEALLGDTLDLDLDLQAGIPRDTVTRLADVFEIALPEPMRDAPDLSLEAGITGPLADSTLFASLHRDDLPHPLVGLSAGGDLVAPMSLGGQVAIPDAGALAEEGAPLSAGTVSVLFDVWQEDDRWHTRADATSGGLAVPDATDVRRLTAHVEGVVSPTPSLRYELDVDGLVPAATPVPLAFRADAAGTFVGTRVTADLMVDELRQEEPIGLEGSLAMDAAAQALHVDALELRLTDEHLLQLDEPIDLRLVPDDLAADGRILALRDDDPSGAITFDARQVRGETALELGVETLDVAPLLVVARRLGDAEVPEVTGVLDGTAALAMGVEPPVVDARLSLRDLVVPDQVRDLDVTLAVDMADDTGEVELSAEAGSRRLVWIDATFPLEPDGFVPACAPGLDATVILDPTDTQALRERVASIPELEQVIALEARLLATGQTCDPTVELAAVARTTYEDQRIVAELQAEDGPDHVLSATVDAALADTPVAQLVARAPHPAPDVLVASDDPVAAFAGWTADARILDVEVGRLVDGLTGAVQGMIHAEGDGAVVRSTDGGLEWNEPGTDAIALDRFTASWSTLDGDVLADLLLIAEGTPVEAHGEAALAPVQRGDPTTPIVLRVPPTDVPLEVAAALSTGVLTDAEGTMHLEATVDGTLAKPEASGAVRIEDGMLVASATGVRYDDLSLAAEVRDREVDLDLSLDTTPRYGRFRDREGSSDQDLTARGTITLQPDLHVVPDLEITMRDFWASATDLATAQLDGTLTAGGQATDIRVRGDIDVTRGRFDFPRHIFIPTASMTLDDDIVFVDERPEVFVVEETSGPSLLSLVDAEVDVHLDRGVRVQAEMPLAADAGQLGALGDLVLDANVDGDVTAAMRYGEIDLLGSLDITGDASLLTAAFEIDEGSVDFIGADVNLPTFDFTFGRSGGGGDVTAVVRGTPEDLRIARLTSSQGLSDADILAQFLFGRPLSDLGDEEAGTAAQAVQRALLSMAGSTVEDTLGVEVVDSVDYSDDGLSLGWNVGGDGFLTVRLDPTAQEDENVAEVTLSWLLDAMTEAELQTGDAGESAAWIRLERRY
jgi:uncharacterized protein involved in outer membrane biogenesis